MPRRRLRTSSRKNPLIFAESPCHNGQPYASPVLAAHNPPYAKCVEIDNQTATEWVSPQFLSNQLQSQQLVKRRRGNRTSTLQRSKINDSAYSNRGGRYKPLTFRNVDKKNTNIVGTKRTDAYEHDSSNNNFTVLNARKHHELSITSGAKSSDNDRVPSEKTTDSRCDDCTCTLDVNDLISHGHAVMCSRHCPTQLVKPRQLAAAVKTTPFINCQKKPVMRRLRLTQVATENSQCLQIDTDQNKLTSHNNTMVSTDGTEQVGEPHAIVTEALLLSYESRNSQTNGRFIISDDNGVDDHNALGISSARSKPQTNGSSALPKLSDILFENYLQLTPCDSLSCNAEVLAEDTPEMEYGMTLRSRRLRLLYSKVKVRDLPI